jgi:hypothetical protein
VLDSTGPTKKTRNIHMPTIHLSQDVHMSELDGSMPLCRTRGLGVQQHAVLWKIGCCGKTKVSIMIPKHRKWIDQDALNGV